ncbi:MAG: hypothetical protein JRJ03_03340 [Deltaproteobacteria bacterium]|nr:hypothetical protein [Deltaproteobacteria bacterium]
MSQQDVKSLFRPSLFWDAVEIDPSKHAGYIIARILDYGDDRDVRKLLAIYSKEEIERVVRTRRGLMPKTGKYWAIKLNVPLTEVACLSRYYQKKR